MARDKVVTRIAPSPTGPLHVGTARAALFNELFAKKSGGSFIMRIEDTDKERSEDKYVQDITNGLSWLGIKWDGEIVRQSERRENHEAAIRQLLDSGMAYQEEGEQAVKFKVEEEEVVFNDLIRGEIKVSTDMWGGDFVIAVDGRRVNSQRFLRQSFDLKRGGDEMRLTVIRGTEELEIVIQLRSQDMRL